MTGQAWAIPLIDAAGTLANGGDFGDALKSAAISYVGGKIGSTVGEVAGQAVADAGGSELASQIIGSGAGKASVALVMGQDPLQAFVSGGLNAGLSAAMGWIETETEGAFSKLPDAAKNVITSGLGAALSGQEVTPELLWNAVLSTKTVTDTVGGFLGDNTDLNDKQISALTLGIQRTAAAAFGGGDVPEAILSSLNEYGQQEFKEFVDNSKVGDAINNTMDKITGDYQRAQAQAEKLDAKVAQHRSAVDTYNATLTEVQDGFAEQTRLETAYERALQNFQANESQANAAALETAVADFNDYVETWRPRYEDVLQPKLDQYEQLAAQYEAEFDAETEVYNDFVADLSVSSDRLNEELKPVYEELDRTFVKFMDPSFNEAEYREIAGLDAGEDAYAHWLAEGKDQGLPTNAAAYDERYEAQRQSVINLTLKQAGLSLTDMNQVERAAFMSAIDTEYPTLQALRNAPTRDLADELLTNQSMADRAAAQGYVAGQTTITPEINAALERAGIPRGLEGEYLTQEDVRALTRAPDIRDVVENIGRQEGVTDEDIADGTAVRLVTPEGLLEWGRISMSVPYWSPEHNMIVRDEYDASLDGMVTVNALNNEILPGPLRLEITAPSIIDLKDENPSAFIQVVGGLSEAAGALIDTQVGQAVSEFARNVVGAAKDTPAVMNTAGIALEAGGELLDTFNNMLLLVNINPASTPMGKTARDMIALGGDVKTDEWNAAVADMNAIMAQGEGWGKVAAVWGGFKEAPLQFTAEIIGKELLQEIPILLASGGTGNITKRLLATAGEQAAQTMARRAALGTAATLDLAESFGGAAGSAYDEAFATAVRTGMSETEAESYARDVAISAGMVGAATTLASMGIGGNAFEKSILGREATGTTAQAFDWVKEKVVEGGNVTWKEGVQESIEEGLPTLLTETVLTQIDPERDVLGAVLQASTLGAIAGAGTAGGIYTGHTVADALVRTNTTVRNAISNGGSDPEAAKAALKDLGLDDEVVQNNILSTVSDQYHSNGDISRAFSANPDFKVTNADVLNGVLNSAGQDVTTYVNTYVDQRYVDIEEVKAAAAAEGVTLTDEQAQDMVTQTGDPEATQAALYSIQQKYDPQAVNEQEARDAFAEQGFDPTPEQLQQFMREGPESDILNELSQFVDVNQVTEEEARQYFADIGYTPTDEEVAQFVRQQAETEVQSELDTYVDPRMVDADEVRAAYEALGLTIPTAADIDALVGQYDEADLAGRAEENLPTARFNALQQQLVEFREALENGGFSTDEIAAEIASVREDTMAEFEALGYTIDEEMGVLRDNIANSEQRLLDQIAANEEAGMTRDQAIQTAVDELATEFGVAREDIFTRIGETEQSLNDRISGVETAVEDLGTQLGDVETALLDQIAANEDAGMARDEALNAAIDEVAQNLNTTRDDLLQQIGETEQSLLDQLAEVQTGLEGQLGDVETRVLDRVQELEDSGIARDTALQTALDELATELGVTEESLLDQIGETEQSLLDQLAEIQTGLEGQLGDVETRVLDRVQELEDSGIARDTALQTALDELATELGVTEESLLDQIGETEQSLLDQLAEVQTGLEGQLGDVETRVLDRVQELEDSGIARDTALQTALDELATELGVTEESLLDQIGETEQSLLDQLAEIQTGLEGQLGDVETRVLDRVQELEDSGIARDTALQTALDELATELGVTEESLLDQIGETEQSLLDQIGGLETTIGNVEETLLSKVQELEDSGIARDEALQTALSELATELGVTETTLLAQMGETAQSLQDQLTGVAETNQADLDFIASLIGKPARDVTQVDIDFVADLIAQQEVITDLTRAQRQYDVTGDGIINQDDFALLEQALAGTDVTFAPGSMFGPATGLYAQNQANLDAQLAAEAETQALIDQQTQTQTQLATQLQTQLQTQAETQAETARRKAFGDYVSQQADLYGQRVDVDTPDPMRINYIYDWQSVFATPSQASLFPSPYAEGGQVEDTTDKLLRIIGETK
jgi:predicted  nucleic acid-binding Zn-ribbon protein